MDSSPVRLTDLLSSDDTEQSALLLCTNIDSASDLESVPADSEAAATDGEGVSTVLEGIPPHPKPTGCPILTRSYTDPRESTKDSSATFTRSYTDPGPRLRRCAEKAIRELEDVSGDEAEEIDDRHTDASERFTSSCATAPVAQLSDGELATEPRAAEPVPNRPPIRAPICAPQLKPKPRVRPVQEQRNSARSQPPNTAKPKKAQQNQKRSQLSETLPAAASTLSSDAIADLFADCSELAGLSNPIPGLYESAVAASQCHSAPLPNSAANSLAAAKAALLLASQATAAQQYQPSNHTNVNTSSHNNLNNLSSAANHAGSSIPGAFYRRSAQTAPGTAPMYSASTGAPTDAQVGGWPGNKSSARAAARQDIRGPVPGAYGTAQALSGLDVHLLNCQSSVMPATGGMQSVGQQNMSNGFGSSRNSAPSRPHVPAKLGPSSIHQFSSEQLSNLNSAANVLAQQIPDVPSLQAQLKRLWQAQASVHQMGPLSTPQQQRIPTSAAQMLGIADHNSSSGPLWSQTQLLNSAASSGFGGQAMQPTSAEYEDLQHQLNQERDYRAGLERLLMQQMAVGGFKPGSHGLRIGGVGPTQSSNSEQVPGAAQGPAAHMIAMLSSRGAPNRSNPNTTELPTQKTWGHDAASRSGPLSGPTPLWWSQVPQELIPSGQMYQLNANAMSGALSDCTPSQASHFAHSCQSQNSMASDTTFVSPSSNFYYMDRSPHMANSNAKMNQVLLDSDMSAQHQHSASNEQLSFTTESIGLMSSTLGLSTQGLSNQGLSNQALSNQSVSQSYKRDNGGRPVVMPGVMQVGGEDFEIGISNDYGDVALYDVSADLVMNVAAHVLQEGRGGQMRRGQR